MAGTPEIEPHVEHGWRATAFALIFAAAVLGGAGIATAVSAPDSNGDESGIEGEDHGDDSDTESDDLDDS